MKVTSQDKVEKSAADHHEEPDFRGEQSWDDVTGEELDTTEVLKARAKEMGYIHEKCVWRRMNRKRAIALGYKVVKTMWIDINKGNYEAPNYRSRFVAKEFNDGAEEGLFASPPPRAPARTCSAASVARQPRVSIAATAAPPWCSAGRWRRGARWGRCVRVRTCTRMREPMRAHLSVNVRGAMCDVQCAMCSVQSATCNVQRATCNARCAM